ncbi:hypothetical protein MACK_002608 [Theileria orientalis]|uniref:STAG domain-containing protein n=1 Tax=Theileria orientalis TaxID=68886 RepID=A0A976MDP2_THEOR|nr:hypothetical protein MACK_002608 [Theileria orientalis]
MAKGILEPDLEACEMIDESDSTEDSDDEDYELGDNLFSKTSTKASKPKSSNKKRYNFKLLRKKPSSVSRKTKRKLVVQSENEDNLSPPSTSRLFQIVIARKHARLSSCLQRTYLSLLSDDKFVTIAEVLSFICECAGFKPNLVNRKYLNTNSEKRDIESEKVNYDITVENFGWNSFRNCYLSLPSSVSYEDVLKYRDKSEAEDETIYGKDINIDEGDSISSLFYNMCNYRIKNLTKMFDGKEGWMIDFGSVGFVRFCEFFNELVLQAEIQYFKDLLELIQWVFVLSLCPYRPIRLLTCVACNEMISSLLVKLDTLKKDQVVLKKQLLVEAELDKRMSGRLGGGTVSLSGSTLELYKRLSLVNITCRVTSAFVKTAFYINYSSKLFDVFHDIRMLTSYYLVVHYLINPLIYEHPLYVELVGRFILNQDDNLVLLLKYLLVYRGKISHKVVDKLLTIYPSARGEVNHLIEFILLKFLNEEGKMESDDAGSGNGKDSISNSDEINTVERNGTRKKVVEKLLNDDFVYENVLNNNSVYFCALYLSSHFQNHGFTLTFNLNLAQMRSKYGYLMNENNKAYNNHVYTYTRLGGSEDTGGTNDKEEEEIKKMKLLCKLLSKHQRRDKFKQFLNNMVVGLMQLDFFNSSLSCLKFKNYSRFATVIEYQGLYNRVLLAVTDNMVTKQRHGSESMFEKHQDERVRNMEDFVKNSHEVYRLNKNSTGNLNSMFGIYKNLLRHKLGSSHKLADLITNKLNYILEHPDLTSKAINILSSMLSSGSASSTRESNWVSGVERSRELGIETESSSNLEKYKSKINSVFNSNVVKFVKYIESSFSEDEFVSGYKDPKLVNKDSLNTREELHNMKLVISALNQFLMSFDFVTLRSNDILTIYNLMNQEQVGGSSSNTNNSSNTIDTTDQYRKRRNSTHADAKHSEVNEDNTSNNERSLTLADVGLLKQDKLVEASGLFKDDRVVKMFEKSGLYWELLILYYLVYEYVIYNTVSNRRYQFERLDELRHKLLCLMLDGANLYEDENSKEGNLACRDDRVVKMYDKEADSEKETEKNNDKRTFVMRTSRKSKRMFVALSSVFNVMKLSNSGFLHSKSGFKLDGRIVDHLQHCILHLLLEAYTTRDLSQGKESKEGQFKKKERTLSLENDGSISINYKYYLNSTEDNGYDQKNYSEERSVSENVSIDLEKENAVNELEMPTNSSSNNSNGNSNNSGGYSSDYNQALDEECLKHLTPVYIGESLIYQCVKTLNSDLFNSNISVVLVVNSCSGVERLRKASLKYLEVLSRLDLWLYNLVMLHTMFTLYELSEKLLLERVVNTFNSFQNEQYYQVIYHVMEYINKSQSNEKFLRYLTMMAMSNVSVKSEYQEAEALSTRTHVTTALTASAVGSDGVTKYSLTKDASAGEGLSDTDEMAKQTLMKDVVNQTSMKDVAKQSLVKNIGKQTVMKVGEGAHHAATNGEIEHLLGCIRVNASTGTHRYNVTKIISRILRSVNMDDENFNSNLLFLRRSLDVKSVERLCRLVESSIQQNTKTTRTTSKNTQGDVVPATQTLRQSEVPAIQTSRQSEEQSHPLKRTKLSSRSNLDDTTLIPDDCGSFNDNTTDGPLMDEDGNGDNDDSEFLITNDNMGYNFRRNTRSSGNPGLGNYNNEVNNNDSEYSELLSFRSSGSSDEYASALENDDFNGGDGDDLTDSDSNPSHPKQIVKKPLAPSVGIKNKIAPIELRDDELDLGDIQGVDEYEPVFDSFSEGDDTDFPKSSCMPSQKFNP